MYQGQGLLGHKKESLVIHVRVPFSIKIRLYYGQVPFSIKRRVYYEKSIFTRSVGKIYNCLRHNSHIYISEILVVSTPPPPQFVERWLYTKSYFLKVQFLRGQFLTKKLSEAGGNFSIYFMIIIVFSQSYCSKLASLKISYDMKIDSL